MRSPANLALFGLPRRPRQRSPRQHSILRRHPSTSRVPHPPWHPVLHRRIAQNPCMPHFNQHRPLRRRHKSRRQLQFPRLMRPSSTTPIQLQTFNLSHTAHYRNPSPSSAPYHLANRPSDARHINHPAPCATVHPIAQFHLGNFSREFLIFGPNLSIEVRGIPTVALQSFHSGTQ